MGSNTEKCPNCGKYMNVGKLMGWNDKTKKADIPIYLVEDNESYSLSILRCRDCYHLKLVVD